MYLQCCEIFQDKAICQIIWLWLTLVAKQRYCSRPSAMELASDCVNESVIHWGRVYVILCVSVTWHSICSLPQYNGGSRGQTEPTAKLLPNFNSHYWEKAMPLPLHSPLQWLRLHVHVHITWDVLHGKRQLPSGPQFEDLQLHCKLLPLSSNYNYNAWINQSKRSWKKPKKYYYYEGKNSV